MTLTAILVILWAHFIGDFILQSDTVARGKSKSNVVLWKHVLLYSIPLVIVGFIVPISLLWVLVNAIGHFITDYFTSRTTSRLWQEAKTHQFFVVIGLDQAIHFSTLFITYFLLCTDF